MKVKSVKEVNKFKVHTGGVCILRGLYNYIEAYQKHSGERQLWQVVKIGGLYYGYIDDNAHAVGE